MGAGVGLMAGGSIVKARMKASPPVVPSLFVRPERISLHGAAGAVAATATNQATGRVRRMSFLGNIVRYTIDVGGADFMVDVQNSGANRFAVEQDVTLSWAVNDSLLLEGGA